MEEKSLQVFDFDSKRVRIVKTDGEFEFVAKDVVEGIGSVWKGNQTIEHVPEIWRGITSVVTPSGKQDMVTLSEPGLYFYLNRSDKPAALPFQMKVAGEIVPSIRKHGAYLTPQKIEEILLNPDAIISLAQAIKNERVKNKELEAKIEADHPKVLFADSVAASYTSILIGDFAKILRQNGIEMGQNRLFQWLRDNGYLISRKCGSFNMPMQHAVENGWFEIKERTINNPDGNIRMVKTPKMTGKGQVYFLNLFLGKTPKTT